MLISTCKGRAATPALFFLLWTGKSSQRIIVNRPNKSSLFVPTMQVDSIISTKEADPAQVTSRLRGRCELQFRRPGSTPTLFFAALDRKIVPQITGKSSHAAGRCHYYCLRDFNGICAASANKNARDSVPGHLTKTEN